MPDSNTFDFICSNNLQNSVRKLIENNIIGLWITQVQKDQLDAIVDKRKRQCISQMPVNFTLTAIVWTSNPEKEKGGYKVPKSNQFRSVPDKDAQIVEELLKDRENISQRIKGDAGIVYTAIKDKMDFLVSQDNDIKQFYDKLKPSFQTRLQLLTNADFELLIKKFLKNLNLSRL